jgi:alpha-mannosidase
MILHNVITERQSENPCVDRSYLLVPRELFLEPHQHRGAAPGVVAAFLALWHPDRLRQATSLPTVRTFEQELGDEPVRALVPRPYADEAAKKFREQSSVSIEPFDLPSGVVGEPAIASFAKQWGLRTDFDDFDRDFFALAFTFLALTVVLQNMGQDDPIDEWSVWRDVETALRLDADETDRRRDSLQAAHESLYSARNLVFPSSVNLLDLALWMGDADDASRRRLLQKPPTNLFITGAELQAIAEGDPDFARFLKEALDDQRVELLSGPFDSRPWTLLPLESKVWQLRKTNEVFQRLFAKDADAFGGRAHALTPDLPALLAKHQFRGCYHGAFDGSGLPHFKASKLNWTALDGTSLETVCKTAASVEDEAGVFVVLKDLARLLDDDRSPVAAFAHRLGKHATWFDWWLRAADVSQVLGRFQTLTDYSLGSALPHHQTHTRAEEYDAKAFETSLGRSVENPVSRFLDFYRRRLAFDAAVSLAGLARGATDGRMQVAHDLERLESAVESMEPIAGGAIPSLSHEGTTALASEAFKNGPQADGVALFNPCSFPRRACVFVPQAMTPKVEAPVRAVQRHGDRCAVVVDVPGWGWAWMARANGSPSSPEPVKPIAAGLKLRNEFIEVEVDKASGGLRGIWDVRTGFSRLGQQLAHASGGKMVARSRTITANGPAFGELATEGDLLSPTGREKWATFKQTFRLWTGRPVLELDVRLDPLRPLQSNDDDYFALRWAWPDEKSTVSTTDGLVLHSHRGAAIEAPMLVDVRERNLLTTILPMGLPFHRRSAPRMMDTVLIAAGETEREFKVAVAIDFARPVTAALDQLQPVESLSVASAPPNDQRTGTFASLTPPAVVASVVRPQPGDDGKVTLRLVETMHKSVRAELKFRHRPRGARFVNGRGDVVYDVYPSGDALPIDFNASETQWIEVAFGPAPAPDDDAEPTQD